MYGDREHVQAHIDDIALQQEAVDALYAASQCDAAEAELDAQAYAEWERQAHGEVTAADLEKMREEEVERKTAERIAAGFDGQMARHLARRDLGYDDPSPFVQSLAAMARKVG